SWRQTSIMAATFSPEPSVAQQSTDHRCFSHHSLYPGVKLLLSGQGCRRGEPHGAAPELARGDLDRAGIHAVGGLSAGLDRATGRQPGALLGREWLSSDAESEAGRFDQTGNGACKHPHWLTKRAVWHRRQFG